MATFPYPTFGNFGPSQAGKIGSVYYRVIDAGGTTRIARTSTGVTERVDAAGNATTGLYPVDMTLDSSWVFPVRAIWDITGVATAVAEETILLSAALQMDSLGNVKSAAQTVADKTGYVLTSGEHTAIQTNAQAALTAQGYTAARAGYMDVLNGLVAAIWANATRTLSDKTGFALTSGERAAIATQVEIQIMDDTDGNAVMTALVNKINEIDPNLGTLTISAIVNAVIAQVERSGGSLALVKAKTDALPSDPASNTQVNTRLASSGYTAPDSASTIAAAVWAASTRTLSSFGTLVADVWSYSTRLLSGFGFTVATAPNATELATKAKTDLIGSSVATSEQVAAVGDAVADIEVGGGSSGAGTFLLTVLVTDGTNPIQGMRVELVGTGIRATTGTNGIALFHVDADSYTVRVASNSRFVTIADQEVEVSDDTDFDIALSAITLPVSEDPLRPNVTIDTAAIGPILSLCSFTVKAQKNVAGAVFLAGKILTGYEYQGKTGESGTATFALCASSVLIAAGLSGKYELVLGDAQSQTKMIFTVSDVGEIIFE